MTDKTCQFVEYFNNISVSSAYVPVQINIALHNKRKWIINDAILNENDYSSMLGSVKVPKINPD